MSVRPSQGLFSALIQNEIGFFCQGNQVDGNFWAKLRHLHSTLLYWWRIMKLLFFNYEDKTMISLLVTYFVREHWIHWNTSFKRKSRGNDTITKTDRGESYSKPVESTRSNKWTAGHLHSEHTSRLPGSRVTFRLRSGFTFTPHLFFLRAEKSTLPARTSLCSLLPCGSPLPYLSSLLSSSVLSPLPLTSALTSCFLALVAYIISPGVLEMWGSGRYSSELQFDDHLNSASSTPWGWCKAVVTEHFCFQFVCFSFLPSAFMRGDATFMLL